MIDDFFEFIANCKFNHETVCQREKDLVRHTAILIGMCDVVMDC